MYFGYGTLLRIKKINNLYREKYRLPKGQRRKADVVYKRALVWDI